MHPESSGSKNWSGNFSGTRFFLRLALCVGLVCGAAAARAASAPSFLQQPANQTVNAGVTAKFVVVTTGTQPLTYQWNHWGAPLSNGLRIGGADLTTLTITNIQKGDEGQYNCTVSNSAGTTQSAVAVLLINAPPSFRMPPSNQVVNPAATANFTCATTGTLPIAYQWKKAGVNLVNGGKINGAQGATLTITNCQVNEEGSYSLMLTNVAGTTTSAPATLSVNRAVTFPLQPLAKTVNLGTTATFTVATSGTLPITYQWKKGGVNVVNNARISGATSTTLVMGSVVANDAANFSCAATNVVGTVQSNSVALTIITPATITVQPGNQNVNTGATATFSVTAAGTAPTYQWKKNGVNMANVAGKIAGALTKTLTISNSQKADESLYTCLVSNVNLVNGTGGSQLSNPGQLKINILPYFLRQPVTSQTVNPMSPVTISVATSGTTPVTWQWRKNGANVSNGGTLAGALTTTLTISSAKITDSATYTCFLSNVAGTTTSLPSVLTVNPPPQILTQPAAVTQLNPRQTYSVNVVTSQSAPVNYQWYKNGVILGDDLHISGSVTASLTVTSVTIADAAVYSCRISYLSTGATVISNNARLIVNPTLNVFSAHGSSTPPVGTSFITSFTLVSASMSGSPEVDSTGTSRFLCTGWTGTGSVAPSGSGTSMGFRIVKDSTLIWNWSQQYQLRADSLPTTGGLVTLSDRITTATNTWYDTNAKVKVFAVPAPGWGFSNWTGDASGRSTSFTLTMNSPKAVQACFIKMPLITKQPVGQTVNPGATASFSVEATSTLPITYHWKRNGVYLADNANICGSTSPTLTLTGVVNAQEGAYICDVGNVGYSGASSSAPAILDVNDPVTFTLQPNPLIVNPGEMVDFIVTATGTAPITYQWKRNGIPLTDDANTSGANSIFLHLNSVQAADEGYYVCEATNITGTTPSNTVFLEVNDPPSFITHPGNQTINPGGIARFTLQTTGTQPIFYQWSKDNGVIFNDGRISGVDTPDLTITSVTMSDAGIYTCQAINSLGDDVSDPIRLTINPTLTVNSMYGTSDPPIGDNIITTDTLVTASIGDSPEVDTTGTTRWLAFGWYGTGSVPANGYTTQTSFLIEQNSSLSWRWKLQYQLQAYSNPPEGGRVTLRDIVTTASGTWWDAGRQLYIRNRPSHGWIFDGWEAGAAESGVATSASLVMTSPLVVGARFLHLPSVLSQSWSQYVNSGAPVALDAVCTGTLPLQYQWTKNGVPLTDDQRVTGTTSSRLQICAMTAADVGNYRCLINNVAGNTSTSQAMLLIKFRLHVSSPYSELSPPAGDNYITSGATVNSYLLNDVITDTSGTTQRVCTGWIGQGAVPAVGTRPHCVFAIDRDSTLTWTWKDRYYLTTDAIPTEGGWVTPASGWYDDETDVQVFAHPALYYEFASWTGNLLGGDASQPGVIKVTMNRPRRVAAIFRQATGTVQITVDPPSTGWLLIDGVQGRHRGNGSAVLTGIPAGPVTLTWLTPWNYQPPAVNPLNNTLAKNGSVAFSDVFIPNGTGPDTLCARIKRYLLGMSVDTTGLDLTGDGVIDSADLVNAINQVNSPAKPAAPGK